MDKYMIKGFIMRRFPSFTTHPTHRDRSAKSHILSLTMHTNTRVQSVVEAAAAMEASATTLSIESFSYRWLINLKSSFDHDSSSFYEESSFIVMDPKTTPSKRFSLQDDQTAQKQYDVDEFNFPTAIGNPTSYQLDHDYGLSTTTIVYAEELFSNGLLMPLFLNNNPSSKLFDSSSNSDTRISSSSSSDVTLESSSTILLSSLSSTNNKTFAKKFYWRSLSKKILKKYLGFLRPLYHKVQRTSPQRFSHGTRTETIDARKPLVVTGYEEGSISEAVLHCRKSIGM